MCCQTETSLDRERTSDGSAISVFVVCDVHLYRDALVELLSGEAGIQVSGACDGLNCWLSAIRTASPDVVIVHAVEGNGPDKIRALVQHEPFRKVLALGLSDAEAEAAACLEAGAAGFISRLAPADQAMQGLRRVAREGSIRFPSDATTLMARQRPSAAEPPRSSQQDELTTREAEVLALIEQGLSNKAIAGVLFIEVAKTNEAALYLYGRLGFVNAGVRKGYYEITGGRRDDAIVMRKDLAI